MLDVVAAFAQPAGLGGVIVGLLIAGVVAVRRDEARRPAARPAAGVAHRESLNAAAANELHRARRYGRPLGLISITTQRKDAARLASDLRANARVTDVVGFVDRSTIVALLPETAGHGAAGLVHRLADLVDKELASSAVVGIASFPESGVTWIGLRASAQQAARPLADFRTLQDGVAELGRSLSPAGVANRGAESAFTTPSAAHVADPAA